MIIKVNNYALKVEDYGVCEYADSYFIKDKIWHNIDFKCLLPPDTCYSLVKFRFNGSIASPKIGQFIQLRPNGDVDYRKRFLCYTQVGHIIVNFDGVLWCGADGTVEYRISKDVVVNLTFYIPSKFEVVEKIEIPTIRLIRED